MDDAELLRRMWPSMWAAFGAVPEHSGGRMESFDGVRACVVPAVPERSVFNSVLYADAESLERAYEQVASIYDDEGIDAWTVWTHPGDERAEAVLEGRGHVLDAQPAAMGLELVDVDGGPPADLDWRPARDARDFTVP